MSGRHARDPRAGALPALPASPKDRTVPLERAVTGTHKLYVTFTGTAGQDFVNLNWFQFGNAPITPAP